MRARCLLMLKAAIQGTETVSQRGMSMRDSLEVPGSQLMQTTIGIRPRFHSSILCTKLTVIKTREVAVVLKHTFKLYFRTVWNLTTTPSL